LKPDISITLNKEIINQKTLKELYMGTNIKEIKNNYQYKYAFIDLKKSGEIYGYIYNVNDKQYFIDSKETYFKLINSI